MPQYWILKTEPTAYSYDQLERDDTTTWDGVRNALAQKHIRQMKRGDQALIYHTGKEKSLIGRATITTDPYPDPQAGDPKIVVVDLQAAGRLPNTVSLATIKATASLATLGLVRMGRLSVVPATQAQWKRLLALAAR